MSYSTWERITAADIRPGDRITSDRNDDPITVGAIESLNGEPNRRIHFSGGSYMQPEPTTKFWRVV